MEKVIQEFASELKRKLGSCVKQVVLFGSRARGDFREGSDYDVLVVVDHKTPELRSSILDIEGELLDRYDAFFASVLRSEEEWQSTQGFPLAINIAREGVVL
ncbi:MAG: nucleotidyltransferase domain-containing protein [Chlamydiae bacterium]|nr:nucleotidyltransferase domain-containing protein [Chlamydiota bacterium]MBI3276796.1 nucleotidyltransferase domain-containing protein [Chlamydiota bacterium]